jgi:hypothetical protein
MTSTRSGAGTARPDLGVCWFESLRLHIDHVEVGHMPGGDRSGGEGLGVGLETRLSGSRLGHRYRFQASSAASLFWVDATSRNASRR